MMRCSQVEKRLAEYTDGLLDARNGERVEAHLAECEACQAAVADMLAATEVLRALAPVRPPATFAPRVRAAVRAQAPRALAPPLLRPQMRAVLSGAFLTGLLVLSLGHWRAPHRVYVPSGTVVAVATEGVAPVAHTPAPAIIRAEAARPGRPTPAIVRRAPRMVRVASARSMNGITGLRPSREGLTPKPAETRVDQPLAPVVGRASTRLAAMAEVSTGPRLTEEAPEVRLVSAPDADLPGAPSPGSGLVADSGFTGGATSSPIAEAEGLLTYEVLYNDDTGISPYAET